jgi:two-component system LytT family response regulator
MSQLPNTNSDSWELYGRPLRNEASDTGAEGRVASGLVRALIVDDEELARTRIKGFLVGHRDVRIVGECEDGRSAVSAILSEKPDLVFLDVQMPGVDGLSVVEAVGADTVPAVLFVTAYDCYALAAFEAHALDYLLKPYSRERFDAALLRCRLQIQRQRRDMADHRVAALLNGLHAKPKYLDRIAIRSGRRIVFRAADDIEWIEADSNHVKLYAGKEIHHIRASLSELEARLDPQKFVRVHRSAVVSTSFIRELRSTDSGDQRVILRDGVSLKLGRTYREHFWEVVGRAR